MNDSAVRAGLKRAPGGDARRHKPAGADPGSANLAVTSLRVLQIEDSEDDAALVLHELRRGGYNPTHERVDSKEAFLDAVQRAPWDVILSDFAMPRFNGMDAFDLLLQSGLDIPFIFVSGRIGEERAVSAMLRGAKDYILKDNLARLLPSIRRELGEAEVRRQRNQAAAALKESEKRLSLIYETMSEPLALAAPDPGGRFRWVSFNTAFEKFAGITRTQGEGAFVDELQPPEFWRPIADRFRRVIDTPAPIREQQIVTLGSRQYALIVTVNPVFDAEGRCTLVLTSLLDVSDLQRATEALRDHERLLQTVFDTLPVTLAVKDADSRYRMVNRAWCERYGVAPQDVVGVHSLDVPCRPEQEKRNTLAEDRKVLAGDGSPVMFEGWDTTATGELRNYQSIKAALRDEQGRATGLVAATVDFTEQKRAEAALRASQRLLRTLVDTIPITLVVKDLETRYLIANRAWCERYGVTPEQVIGKKSLEIPTRPMEEKLYTLEQDRQTLSGESNQLVFEGWDTNARGQKRHYRSIRAPLRDESGTVIGLVNVTIDLTELKQAEEMLQANERLLRTVFDAIPHHLIVKDLQGRYLMVNKAWCEALGFKPEDVLHRSTADLTTRPRAEIERILEEDRRVLQGTVLNANGPREITIKSGEKRIFQGIKAPFHDEHGAPVGLVIIAMDVTPEMEAQRKADTSHARLVEAIESLPAAFLMYDAQERLLLWNSRTGELFPDMFAGLRAGMSFEEVTRSAVDTGIADAEGKVDEWVHQRVERFRNSPGAYELKLKDGRWIQGIDRRTSDGGTICLRIDITDAKRQEEMLRQSQKMEAIGNLAGGISHDFNNLLSIILSQTEFIIEAAGSGPIADDARMIQAAGDRAAALTRQLLAFSRKQVLQLRNLDINEAVRNIEKMLKRLIGENIDLRANLAPAVALIRADESQIEQIILNLAVNARDAMPAGGSLLIETANRTLDASYHGRHPDVVPGDYVMLAVSDTGHGMDQQTQERIFEPFFTTKPLGQGTGMGLATVHGIVKQMNGSIFAYSEVGQGTSFKVYFPISAEQPSGGKAEEQAHQRKGASETVLLVEDEEMVRQSAVRILESAGYTVLQAANAQDALKIAESVEANFDLLLTDVVMPGLSGRELWDQVRELRPVRVLFMSGYTDDAVVRHGILERSVAFLNKPFNRLSLLNKVREVLEGPLPPGNGAA